MKGAFTTEWYYSLPDRMKTKITLVQPPNDGPSDIAKRLRDTVDEKLRAKHLKERRKTYAKVDAVINPKPTSLLKQRKLSKFEVTWYKTLDGITETTRSRSDALLFPEVEVKGIPGRKYRFDFAWRYFGVALEIDGGIWLKKGGHTTGTGKTRDCQKDWLAYQHGWTVIRWTPAMITPENCQILYKQLISTAPKILI